MAAVVQPKVANESDKGVSENTNLLVKDMASTTAYASDGETPTHTYTSTVRTGLAPGQLELELDLPTQMSPYQNIHYMQQLANDLLWDPSENWKGHSDLAVCF